MHCTNCGAGVVEGAAVCTNCGYRPRQMRNFCWNCGTATQAAQVVCVQCGVALGPVASSGAKNKMVAGLLGIFLGGLGIHKFYLGYSKAGVIMLVIGLVGIILAGIPSIIIGLIGFIEGIIYLTKSDEDFDMQYVQNEKQWF